MCFKQQLKANLRLFVPPVIWFFLGAPVASRLMKNVVPPTFDFGAATVFGLLSLFWGFVAYKLGVYGIRHLFAPPRKSDVGRGSNGEPKEKGLGG